jgi:RNA polymerase sigma-B factor
MSRCPGWQCSLPASDPTVNDRMPDPEIEQAEKLLAEFQATGDLTRRDEAIELTMALAERLARRFEGRGEDPADLRQVAMVGLVQAADRFDPDRPGGFVPFAVATILGELKRHFRDRTWALRVPRSVKDESLSIRAAVERLEQRHAPVTMTALAAESGLTEDEVLEGLEGYQARLTVSLDAPHPARGDEGAPLVESIGRPDEAIETAVDLAALRPTLERLGPRDRQLLELRFLHEMSQAEIGRLLGVSQMQVSRLLRSVCERLRTELLGDA